MAWYDLDGAIASCIAAYQPVGAASYAASLVNLANPGTYDATEGTAPDWSADNGWDFVGGTGVYAYHLWTGVTPEADQTWSMIIRFSNATLNNSQILAGSYNSGGGASFRLGPRRGPADDMIFGNGAEANLGSRQSSGVIAVAGANCYHNKTSQGTIATGYTNTPLEIAIGGMNYGASGKNFYTTVTYEGYIQAIAIYSTDISASISDLTDAMNALPLTEDALTASDLTLSQVTFDTPTLVAAAPSVNNLTALDLTLAVISIDTPTFAARPDTPSCRMLTIEAEDRTLAIEAEKRGLAIYECESAEAYQITNYYNGLTASDLTLAAVQFDSPVLDWWLAGGIDPANCIAAYQFIDNIEPDRNLASLGTYDLAVNTRKIGMFDTEIKPENDQTWSMIARFSNAATNGLTIAGCSNTSGSGNFYLWGRRGSADDRLYGNGGIGVFGERVADGVIAIAGANCYYNKSLDGAVSAGWDVLARTIAIGGSNVGAGDTGFTPVNKFDGDIQAVAIYDIDISDYISDLTDSINSLNTDYVPGSWNWFTRPQVVYYNGILYWSALDSFWQVVRTYSYNYSTGVLTKSDLGLGSNDDHDGAALLIRNSDKKVMAFRCDHNDTTITQFISSSAENITAWGGGVSLDSSLGGVKYSYPTVLQLTGETNDPIYLFYRNHDGANWDGQHYSKSEDGGTTWAAGTKFFYYDDGTEQRPYFQITQNGTDRIDFACTQGMSFEVTGNDILHFYYTGGKYYKSDGTEITAALPLTDTDVTLVYDGSTYEGYVYDIAIDDGGNPVIVFAKLVNLDTDHRYMYAKWNGTSWVVTEICEAGGKLADNTDYSGGVTIDKGDVNTIWCSRNTGSQWEIWKYTTADGGTTWSGEAQTSNSDYINGRPYCAFGATGKRPLWWYGDYDSYTDTISFINTENL